MQWLFVVNRGRGMVGYYVRAAGLTAFAEHLEWELAGCEFEAVGHLTNEILNQDVPNDTAWVHFHDGWKEKVTENVKT